MLGAISPVIIIGFKRLIPTLPDALGKIPVVSDVLRSIPLVPIPIYLDPDLTGLQLDTNNKSIDAETDTQTLSSGGFAQSNQKGLSSLVTINLIGEKDSIGLNIVSALMDQIFQKLTSKEYSITYINGGILIFGGLLHSFSINQSADTTKFDIQIQISNASDTGTKPPVAAPDVAGQTGTTQVLTGGN